MTQGKPSTLTASLAQISLYDTATLQQAMDTICRELRSRPDADTLYLVWWIDDIQCRRPDLTIQQCREVLKALEKGHDANYGIGWETIDIVADNCYREPDNINELREQFEFDR